MDVIRHRRVRRTFASGVALLVVATGSVIPAAAAPAAVPRRGCTTTWIAPGDGDWSVPANWSLGRVPRSLDHACLPTTGRPRITLTRDVAVDTVLVGSATLQIATPKTLSVAFLTFDGPGGLDGGTVQATSLYLPVRSTVTFGGGVAVTTGGVSVLNATLAVRGGSTVRVTSYAQLTDTSVTDDGSAGNLLTLASVYARGAVSIAVPLRYGKVYATTGSLALPRLLGAQRGGTTLLPDTTLARVVLTVPYPITTLAPGSSLSVASSTVVAASTGTSALAAALTVHGRLANASGTPQFDVLTVAGDGTLDAVSGVVGAPHVDVVDGGGVLIRRNGAVHLGDATPGVLALRGSGPSGPSSLSLQGGTLQATLDQGGGEVVSVPDVQAGHVEGDWRSAAAAQLTLTATGAGSRVASPSNVLVSGTARLGGALSLIVDPHVVPRVGYSEVLLTASGGLVTDYSRLTAPPGWRLRTNATSISATYDGPGAG